MVYFVWQSHVEIEDSFTICDLSPHSELHLIAILLEAGLTHALKDMNT